MAKDYTNIITEIIDNIGGKSNVVSVTHCATRLRFVLKDDSLAETDKLKAMKEVVTVVEAGGQYQVVIGSEVKDYYGELVKQLALDKNVEHNIKEDKKSVGKIIVDFMAGVFFPVFNLLAASGVLKGILAIVVLLNPALKENGLYLLFNGLSDALFLFLPIFLGYTTAEKLGIPGLFGVLIGSALCYPELNGTDLIIFGNTINVSYQSTFLPIVLILLLAKPIYQFFDKVIPSVIKSFTVPLLTMSIIFPIGFLVIGPVSNYLANVISHAILSLYGFNAIVAGLIVGLLWQILVLFGLHGILISVVIVNVFNGKGDLALAVSIFVAFAQTATIAGIATKTKNPLLRTKVAPAIVSGIFGITEPAIYGITLPRMKMFITSCISGGIAGAIVGFLGIKKYAPESGIFALPTMINPQNPQIIPVGIALIVTVIVAFVLALVVYKDDDYKEID